MKKSLHNERVIITGASSGIGKEMAIEVAARGGEPVLLARSVDKLEHLSRHIYENTGVKAPYYKLDVTSSTAIKSTFNHIFKEAAKPTTLINNAGFAIFDYAENATEKDIEDMFRVNVFGTIACTQAAIPYMKENNYGQVIFIASLAGKMATPKASVYSATKHAVLGFANALRMEMKETPVHVSVVNPGPVRTNFFQTADSTGDYEKNVEKMMLEPDYVSSKIVKLVVKPKREINLPGWMGTGAKLYQLFPGVVEKLAGKRLNRK
ncbi:SDR family NAD(P)-dependent oxidoreductase [Salipaludibacillus aurantiacus]|uniref:Short-chain dehydrogenase n=1 Tax=Salipaludibacillus aurantiacus TaxID=1601833 RepID=A0A1H9PHT9_9BACI|nr:SDR family oxidoreductase [Salipaludibacillus aurantiacus]SER47435.1 hypothetical protein SAMN05518684_101311 [Salipaludibacillus aurantiacus]